MEGADVFFRQLFEIPENKKCVDCGQISPEWTSVNNGIFVCLNCASVHRRFGVNVSFIRSISMDSWSDTQIQLMNYGGNKRFNDFMTYYKLATDPPLQKYNSQAAIYYRNRLKALADKTEFTEPPSYEEGRNIIENESGIEKNVEGKTKEKKDVVSIVRIGFHGFMCKTAELSKKAKESRMYDSMKKAGGQIKQGSVIAGHVVAHKSKQVVDHVSKGTKYAAHKVVHGSKVAAAKVKEKTDIIANNPKVHRFTTGTKNKFNEAGTIIKSKYKEMVNKDQNLEFEEESVIVQVEIIEDEEEENEEKKEEEGNINHLLNVDPKEEIKEITHLENQIKNSQQNKTYHDNGNPDHIPVEETKNKI